MSNSDANSTAPHCPTRHAVTRWLAFVPVVAVSAVLLAVSGCGKAPAPEFRLNMLQMVASETSEPYQQEIADVLAGLFGAPDEPFAPPETGLDANRLQLSAGPAWSDGQGVNRGLYRKHCVHCHGVSGDGKGPTGQFLNPYPRDYRTGIFKFKSTLNNGSKPTDADLHRVLDNGIPGTSMPSFSLLSSPERESLVEYVKYLAIRGEMETKLIDYVLNDLGEEDQEGPDGTTKKVRIALDPANNPEQSAVIKELLVEVMEAWQTAAENVIVPTEEQIPSADPTPEELAASVAKGRELFYGPKANCVKCHGPTGLGDGQRTDYDVWTKQAVEFVAKTGQLSQSIEEDSNRDDLTDEEAVELELDRENLHAREAVADTLYAPRNAIPRNLRAGIYRGGRRRIDVFWRISAGIAGSPMPGVGAAAPGAQGTLSEAEIWNLVDYVLALPYEAPSNAQPELQLDAQEIVSR